MEASVYRVYEPPRCVYGALQQAQQRGNDLWGNQAEDGGETYEQDENGAGKRTAL